MQFVIILRSKFFTLRSILYAYFCYYRLLRKKYVPISTRNVQITSILHINTTNYGGGAAKIAADLINYQTNKGLLANFIVGTVTKPQPNVVSIPLINSKSQDMLRYAQNRLQWQDFFELRSFNILQHNQFEKADIIHLHNLHGNYFSPFTLPAIAANKPVIWSLHDMHALTGHCAHSFSCNRWKTGCGNCPDLQMYPKITKDTTNIIWKTKQVMYEKSTIHIVALSYWLQSKISESMLASKPCTVIHNGIDTNIYKPLDTIECRNALQIPAGKKVVLFSADLGLQNPFKGGEFVQKLILETKDESILFVNIGGGKQVVKEPCVWTIPYITNQLEMAKWYSAADVYLYPSLADNCPLVVLEAMACKLPILTFETGGIPELVIHNSTGYVAKYKNYKDLLVGFRYMIENEEILKTFSENAFQRVQKYFTIQIMNDKYLDLYKSIMNN